MRKSRRILYRTAVGFLAAITVLASCQTSDTDTEGLDIHVRNKRCMLLPPGIRMMPFGARSAATRAARAIKEEQRAFNQGISLANIITMGNSQADEIPKTRILNPGVYCRMVIYKKEEWNNSTMKIHEQRLCKQGSSDYQIEMGDTSDPIYLEEGDYKVFVYSYNSKDPAKLEKIVNGEKKILLEDGDDYLSTVEDLTVGKNDVGNIVDLGTINLQHRCCQLIGELVEEGFSEDVRGIEPGCTLNISTQYTSKGEWDIRMTQFEETQTSQMTKEIPITESLDQYRGAVIILPIKGKEILASYEFKPRASNKAVSAVNSVAATSATLTSGGSYSVRIKAIGANVITEADSVKIGNTIWATRNMANNYGLSPKPWQCGYLNGQQNDFWSWGFLNPWDGWNNSHTGFKAEWPEELDPCYVYLGKQWRIPSVEQAEELGQHVLANTQIAIGNRIYTTGPFGEVLNVSHLGLVFRDKVSGETLFLPNLGFAYQGDYQRAEPPIAMNNDNRGNIWLRTTRTVNTELRGRRFEVNKHYGPRISYGEPGYRIGVRCAQ